MLPDVKESLREMGLQMILMQLNTGGLSSTIEFLTAMITPVLLISATGTLVLSTSTRLGRVIDRVRALDERLAELMSVENHSAVFLYERRLEVVFDLLDKVTSRSRLLQKAMVVFYYGLGFFVLTSVSIGAVGLLNVYRWAPIAFGLIGIGFLTYGSFMLMLEAKLATGTINAEMDFTWELARKAAPSDLVKRYPDKGIYGSDIFGAILSIFRDRRFARFKPRSHESDQIISKNE